jgi:DNA-binding transcriptional ArsR family regulator
MSSASARLPTARSARKRHPEQQLVRAAPIFAALGDETRLEIVTRLGSSGPLSIARLSAGRPVTRQAISKHLGVLANAGLVRSRRRGRERIWSFEAKRIDEARRCLDRISEQWDQALERLKQFVED